MSRSRTGTYLGWTQRCALTRRVTPSSNSGLRFYVAGGEEAGMISYGGPGELPR